ncbi:hypothetical protein FSP39_004129, partial [Pinctada imbricata]
LSFCFPLDPCQRNTLLHGEGRDENSPYQQDNLCDDLISSTWYRIVGSAVTSCPAISSCGSLYPVWLNETVNSKTNTEEFTTIINRNIGKEEERPIENNIWIFVVFGSSGFCILLGTTFILVCLIKRRLKEKQSNSKNEDPYAELGGLSKVFTERNSDENSTDGIVHHDIEEQRSTDSIESGQIDANGNHNSQFYFNTKMSSRKYRPEECNELGAHKIGKDVVERSTTFCYQNEGIDFSSDCNEEHFSVSYNESNSPSDSIEKSYKTIYPNPDDYDCYRTSQKQYYTNTKLVTRDHGLEGWEKSTFDQDNADDICQSGTCTCISNEDNKEEKQCEANFDTDTYTDSYPLQPGLVGDPLPSYLEAHEMQEVSKDYINQYNMNTKLPKNEFYLEISEEHALNIGNKTIANQSSSACNEELQESDDCNDLNIQSNTETEQNTFESRDVDKGCKNLYYSNMTLSTRKEGYMGSNGYVSDHGSENNSQHSISLSDEDHSLSKEIELKADGINDSINELHVSDTHICSMKTEVSDKQNLNQYQGLQDDQYYEGMTDDHAYQCLKSEHNYDVLSQ